MTQFESKPHVADDLKHMCHTVYKGLSDSYFNKAVIEHFHEVAIDFAYENRNFKEQLERD